MALDKCKKRIFTGWLPPHPGMKVEIKHEKKASDTGLEHTFDTRRHPDQNVGTPLTGIILKVPG